MTWFIDLRADSYGGKPAGSVGLRQDYSLTLDLKALIASARGKHVLFATHGFNVNRYDGIRTLSEWSQLVKIGDDALFVGVLWPGDSRWLPVIDYPFEGNEAMASARLLAPYIDEHFKVAASVSFVSHSLGARMVLQTVRHMRLFVRQLILMAGAIDDDCLSKEYRDAITNKKVGYLSVLASRGDHVLKLAFPVGNPLAGIITRGHPYWQGALGYDGPDSPYPYSVRLGWQIPDDWAYDHGDYLGGSAFTMHNVDITTYNTPTPNIKPLDNQKTAWSAAFVSTRFA